MTDSKKADSAITKVNGFIKYSNGNIQRKRTTHRRKILVEWNDISVYWVPLKGLKQSNTVELDEYDVMNSISDEPDFRWWDKETLYHWDMIISKEKAKYCRTTHNFGIQLSNIVK